MIKQLTVNIPGSWPVICQYESKNKKGEFRNDSCCLLYVFNPCRLISGLYYSSKLNSPFVNLGYQV